ncbi:MAG: hypothetical protein HY078_16125 [Elusimicrobia bacterium]|nr:hypothetical protein [Elusimicrobiota bacterium]
MMIARLLIAPLLAFGDVPVQVEAPSARPYVEASPELFARRARACREDLKDYDRAPSRALLDRLAVCMEHPDAELRASVLDRIPDRRLWDLSDYESGVEPLLQDLSRRFEHDPDWKVSIHAGQLRGFISNTRHWLAWESPAAQARRGRKESESRGRSDEPFTIWNLVLFGAAVTCFMIVQTLKFRKRGGKRRY